MNAAQQYRALGLMDIPVYCLVRDIDVLKAALIGPRYILMMEKGSWAAQNDCAQQESLSMLKRLVQALHWNWDACVILESVKQAEQDSFIKSLALVLGSGLGRHQAPDLAKMIIFGENLESIFRCVQDARYTDIINVHAIMIASITELMSEPQTKREAWGRLTPTFME